MLFKKGYTPWNKGGHLSEETRKKMSESRTGRPSPTKGRHMTEEQRKRISDSLKGHKGYWTGKKLSEEHRTKIGEAGKGRVGPWMGKTSPRKGMKTGKPAWNRGLHPSEETRKKMSESRKGKPGHKWTSEQREKYLEVFKERRYTPKSAGEKEMADFIKSIYSGTVKCRDHKTLGGFELDVYLPELKLAFEYNGEYWHGQRNKNYERVSERDAWKRRECRKKKIALLNVWEKDWMERPEYIKGFISALINNKPTDCFVHP